MPEKKKDEITFSADEIEKKDPSTIIKNKIMNSKNIANFFIAVFVKIDNGQVPFTSTELRKMSNLTLKSVQDYLELLTFHGYLKKEEHGVYNSYEPVMNGDKPKIYEFKLIVKTKKRMG